MSLNNGELKEGGRPALAGSSRSGDGVSARRWHVEPVKTIKESVNTSARLDLNDLRIMFVKVLLMGKLLQVGHETQSRLTPGVFL